MYSSFFVASTLLAAGQLVAGHGAIIQAVGDLGGMGSALAVDASTPRTGTGRNPFQQDSTRFRGASAATCGETLGGGANQVESGTAGVLSAMGGTLPQVSAGGSLTMTIHQVNADGAGPYKCMIDASGAGTNWTPITVTTNVPGDERGRNRDGQTTAHPLVAQIPAGQTCEGNVAGESNVCMVRCENPARAGPFGGCVPVQLTPGGAAPAPGAGAGAGAATPAAPATGAGAAVPATSAGARTRNGGAAGVRNALNAREQLKAFEVEEEEEEEDEE